MKEKWNEFIESLRKDKKKGLIVFVVFFGLIGTILMGVFLGNGKTEQPEEGTQVSSVEIPVDTMSFNSDQGKGTYGGSNDFFSDNSQAGGEELESESKNQSVSSPSSGSTYYKPKNYYSTGTNNNSYSNSEKNKVTSQNSESTEEVSSEKRKRTRVPTDESGNMSGVSGKLYRASVANGDQTVKAGSYVKVRLAEDMNVNGLKVPKNTVVTGIASVQQERMKITVTSVKIGTDTRTVKWIVFDEDGNEGVAIPSHILNDIAKDGAKETIEQGNKVEATVPIVGSVKVNLQKKNQEVSFVIRDGHRIYIKEEKK